MAPEQVMGQPATGQADVYAYGVVLYELMTGVKPVRGDRLEQVFDRFYSERPKGEKFGQHSGLGLSISRQIIEALRGQIAADNRRGIGNKVLGARFVVQLPRV